MLARTIRGLASGGAWRARTLHRWLAPDLLGWRDAPGLYIGQPLGDLAFEPFVIARFGHGQSRGGVNPALRLRTERA